jgi:hypothetical protein
MEKLTEQAEKKNLKIVFGLEAQEHIPTIQAELKRWNENEYNTDMTYNKHVWEGIGKIIGWCPFTACLSYFEWLHKNSSSENE